MNIYFLLIFSNIIFCNQNLVYHSKKYLQGINSLNTAQNTPDCNPIISSVQNCFSQCILMYKGNRNYFNQNTGQCEQTAQCSNLQIYNISNNTCSPLPNSNINYPNINTNINTQNNNQLLVPQIVCINGNFIANNTICICNQGYTDGPQDSTKPNIVVKCAQSINNTNSNNMFSNNTSSYYPYPVSSGNFTVSGESNNLATVNNVIIIVVCLIVSGYAFCGILYYCKYKMKSKTKLDNYSIQAQPIPIFNSQFSHTNLTNLDNLSREVTNRTLALKPQIRLTNQYENKIFNSYRDASFNKRYQDLQRNKDLNTSTFNYSPINNFKRNKKISRSEMKGYRMRKNNYSSDDEEQ